MNFKGQTHKGIIAPTVTYVFVTFVWPDWRLWEAGGSFGVVLEKFKILNDDVSDSKVVKVNELSSLFFFGDVCSADSRSMVMVMVMPGAWSRPDSKKKKWRKFAECKQVWPCQDHGLEQVPWIPRDLSPVYRKIILGNFYSSLSPFSSSHHCT